jgi:hypothetical protein
MRGIFHHGPRCAHPIAHLFFPDFSCESFLRGFDCLSGVGYEPSGVLVVSLIPYFVLPNPISLQAEPRVLLRVFGCPSSGSRYHYLSS